jgi:hypothetical protein
VQRIAILLLLVALVGGCTPKPGDACKPGNETCADAKSALACIGGRVNTVPCRGPSGCTRTGDVTACDNTVAEDGDVCPADDDSACSAKHDAMLVCRGGRFAVAQRCRGDRGCQVSLDRATCDVGLAEAGDVCREEGNRACSVDHASLLACTAGKFAVALKCRGARGCRVGTDKVDCDDTIADVGDACEAASDTACATDGRTLLTCKDHQFAMARACKTKCAPQAGAIACD